MTQSSAQREVVRRLHARAPDADLTALEALIDHTPVGGRGAVDFVGPGPVPPRELLRVAVSVLTRMARSAPPDALITPELAPRRRFWGRPAYQLAGSGALVPGVRAALRAGGAAEGGLRPRLIVLVGPVDDHAAARWRERVLAGNGLSWRRFWNRADRADRLPVDPLASLTAARPRAVDPVLVVAPSVEEAASLVAAELGLRRPPGSGHGEMGIDISGTDLIRRYNHLTASAGPRLRPTPAIAEPLGPPEDLLPGAIRRAERLADELAATGLPVRGDLSAVVPSSGPIPRVARARTLPRALDELLSAHRRGWTELAEGR